MFLHQVALRVLPLQFCLLDDLEGVLHLLALVVQSLLFLLLVLSVQHAHVALACEPTATNALDTQHKDMLNQLVKQRL